MPDTGSKAIDHLLAIDDFFQPQPSAADRSDESCPSLYLHRPSTYFTGTVRLDPVFPVSSPSRVSGGHVTFEPGARSNWHTHPLGQTLIITSGLGWVQREGGSIEEVRVGDVVWFPPGLKHWHGASATNAMSHYAIQETLDGKNVDWLERVSDEQYRK